MRCLVMFVTAACVLFLKDVLCVISGFIARSLALASKLLQVKVIKINKTEMS